MRIVRIAAVLSCACLACGLVGAPSGVSVKEAVKQPAAKADLKPEKKPQKDGGDLPKKNAGVEKTGKGASAKEACKTAPDVSPYESGAEFVAVNKIDEIVARNLKLRGLKPAGLSSDAVFLRRAYIDVLGTIPDEKSARKFIADASKDKRKRLVKSLLSSEGYAVRMAQRFGDVFRIKAEFPINLWPNAAQAYTRFVFDSLNGDMPYDVMVRRILTSEGSNFRVGEVNFFRAMQSKNAASIASNIALSFMGMRFEKMPESMRVNMAAFFERVAYKSTKEWKEEIVFYDPTKRAPFSGTLPDGTAVRLSSSEDPRAAFADWLTKKGNPYFSRAVANRMWYWIFGQPIVSPVDDMFAENPPANRELLDHLAGYLESNGFSLKKLAAYILNSRTYQQSPIPRCDSGDARKYFAVYPVRRMDAEVLIDVICKLTGSAEIYESTTPEPYTKFPAGESAVAMPDGSVTTSFLELFGKPSRDTGLDSERVNAPSASQKLHMINSWHIRVKLESGEPMRALYARGKHKFLEGAYLAFYSRYPTEAEKKNFNNMRLKRSQKEKYYIHYLDTAWALLNSEEFINNH